MSVIRRIGILENPYEQLTRRERHVLRLLAEGWTTRDVTQALGILPRYEILLVLALGKPKEKVVI